MLVKHERRPFRFGVTLLAGLLGCLSLMGCKDEKTGAQAPTVPAVEVAVEIVTPQKVLYTTELAGRTSGFQIAEVRPQVSGIIQKRFFEEGADVKGNPTTYVVNAENKVEIRPLKVGRTQGNSWVVLDGLKAGDKVIVEGLQKIRPGSPVRIAEPTPVKQGAPASEKR